MKIKLPKPKIYWRKFNIRVLMSLEHTHRYLWKSGDDVRVVTYYQWDKLRRGYFSDGNQLIDPDYIANL